MQGTLFKSTYVVARTGAVGASTLREIYQLEIPVQALLISMQFTPRLIHLSTLDQNKPSDCSVEWDLLWKMGLLKAPCY